MLKFKVYSREGNVVGEQTLLPEIFGIEPNDKVIYEAIRMYQANKRQGTASTKKRSEVRGGGRKPWIQKHTGRARAGTIRSPLWPGGGIVFGPKPRDYSYKIPKKKLKLAFKSALSYKAKDGKILLFDKFEFPEPKTKLFANMLKTLGLDSKKAILFVHLKEDSNFYKGGRNIKNVNFRCVNSFSTLDVVGADTLVFSLESLSKLTSIHKKT